MSVLSSAALWRTGAIFVTAGVITGAFGTHGLRSRLEPDQLQAWQTASSYAITNGVALLALSLHPRFSVHRFAGPAIALGSALFSGTIWALVLAKPRLRFLGPVTPLGGTFLIAGYASLIF